MFNKDDIKWRKFLRKNLLIYLITNVGFNFIIPYSAFTTSGALYLFTGKQCIARFLLPLAFFIPLLVTIDVANKLKKYNTIHELNIPLFGSKGYNKSVFINSMKHSLIIGCTILLLMFVVQLLVSNTFIFPPLWTSLCISLFAGLLSCTIMFRTIKLHHQY